MKIDKDARLIAEAYKRIQESLYGDLSNKFDKWGIDNSLEKQTEPGHWLKVKHGEEQLLDYLEDQNEKRPEGSNTKLPTTYDYIERIGATEDQILKRWNELKDGKGTPRRSEENTDIWKKHKPPTPLEYYLNYIEHVNNNSRDYED